MTTTLYKELFDFAKRYDVYLLKDIEHDLYVYFEGYYNSPKERVIVKFYMPEKSDQDNEYEVLKYLEEKGVSWAPKPILYAPIYEEIRTGHSNVMCKGDSVYAMIVYSLVEGEHLLDVKKRLQDTEERKKEMCRCYEDVYKRLQELHSLGLVVGLSQLANTCIKRTPDGEYVIVRFSRCYSAEHTPFRPMRYLFEDGEGVPTQEDDIKTLKRMCEM